MFDFGMKHLIIAHLSILAVQPALAEDKPGNWMMSYYKKPNPERVVVEIRSMTQQGMLKKESAQPPIIAFLSQVMAANPKQVPKWLEEFKTLDEKQRLTLWAAAWYSDTAEAKDFFRKQQLEAYLRQPAPKILELEVNNPSTLDMLWGYFLATGEEKPIRRIISAFGLSKHTGALERYKTSEKTEQAKKEAYLDITFQAAQWSLESNCREHPLVLKHCEAIFADPKLPQDQSLWLGVVLTKVKPEKYSIKFGERNSAQGREVDALPPAADD